MTLEKGDFVLTTRSGRGDHYQGWGTEVFAKDEELIITSFRGNMVNVKRSSKRGTVFKVPRDILVKPSRKLGETPEGGVPIDDPSIQWVFEDARRLADRLGLCSDFDRISDALGVPGRMRTWDLKIEVAPGIFITGKIDAQSKKLAEEQLKNTLAASPTAHKAIGA